MTELLCIDIGGTAIKSARMAGDGLMDLAERPTPASAEGIAALVREMAAACPETKALGVGTAGEVNLADGSIRLSDNIPGYTGFPLRQRLQEGTGLPTAVENDVNAAALGELHFGAARAAGLNSFLMVSYGTGIGGAIVRGGRLERGENGSAGEIGGLVTHPEALEPGRQGSGSYEQYASTGALVRRALALGPHLHSGRAVFAHRQEAPVAAVVEAWADEIALGLAGAIHLLDPGAVLLGGGIMQEAVLQEMLARRLRFLLKPSFQGTRLLPAALGNQAALYGAGQLAAEALRRQHP